MEYLLISFGFIKIMQLGTPSQPAPPEMLATTKPIPIPTEDEHNLGLPSSPDSIVVTEPTNETGNGADIPMGSSGSDGRSSRLPV